MGDREGEALWSAKLEALLHQGEAVFPTEQADVAQQMQRYLHILDKSRAGLQTVIHSKLIYLFFLFVCVIWASPVNCDEVLLQQKTKLLNA